jgi:polyisoprenoid-binding protein YceI
LQGLAHEHLVSAPIAMGRIVFGLSPAVEIAFNARDLVVQPNPKISDKDQRKIQQTMQEEVIEAGRFPEIRFESTQVMQVGPESWQVLGRLTLHGTSRNLTLSVRRNRNAFTGSVQIKQTDFGIRPQTVAGGLIQVKDEVDVEFAIVTGGAK